MTQMPPLGVPLPPPPEDPADLVLSLGRRGEALVAKDLRSRGWGQLERNTKIAGVELDILARTAHRQLVVEVKTSKALLPECNLQRKQMERLFRALKALSQGGTTPFLLLASLRFSRNKAVELRYFEVQAE